MKEAGAGSVRHVDRGESGVAACLDSASNCCQDDISGQAMLAL